GIAYGSDVELARRLLLGVAKANPRVLEEPPPTVVFRAFGESSLDFELRVFLAARDYWVDATDQLHTGIDQAFRKANIEIAFPQRDIHIRSVVERGGPVVDEAAGGESRPQ
ncbi:MAG: mechanosensitive ion channel, partial [Phycisphaerales bacterium]|nr:mechanosensitive ion channel [Phycisphaerales bacterium]